MAEQQSTKQEHPKNPYLTHPDLGLAKLLPDLYARALPNPRLGNGHEGTARQHREAVKAHCECLLDVLPKTLSSLGEVYARAVETGELQESHHLNFGWFVKEMFDLLEALELLRATADYELREGDMAT